MAFFDDKKMLLAHIRHSFITSDDTGMCELIMVNEDVDQEIQSDHSFQKKSMRMHQRYKQSQWGRLNYLASSFDIQTSPTLGRRPPMRNTSNMFQVMEEKKKKNEKVKTITWRETPEENFDSSLFARQPISKPALTSPSPLAKLLAEQEKKVSNPFFQYSKFNGENHGASSANKYSIFLAMAKDPLTPVNVAVLHSATVEDLIGLTFWKYREEGREPLEFKSISRYAVMIAEDDGEIDTDLPELQKDDHIGKFGFKYLGIVEQPEAKVVMGEGPSKKLNIVKVHYEHGGFSTIAVDNLQVEMSEILTRVIRKRRLQMQGYELERRDSPGELVDLSSTLDSLGTMDFMLVGHSGHRGSFSGEEDVDTPTGRRYCNVKVELTSHQYKAYNVTLVQKKTRTKVQLGIDPKWIEIQPIDHSGKSGGIAGLLKARPVSQVRYDINTVCNCELVEEKLNGQSMIRLTYYLVKEGFRSSEFETYTGIAKEIVRKVKLILEASPSNAQAEYEKRDAVSRGRRGSRGFSYAH